MKSVFEKSLRLCFVGFLEYRRCLDDLGLALETRDESSD